MYVSEYGNHCITKLTTKGQYLARFGSEGSDPGQLFGPASLTTDGEYIYVTELGIDRVSIFDTKGSFVHCFWNRGKEDDSISHGIAIGPIRQLVCQCIVTLIYLCTSLFLPADFFKGLFTLFFISL